jgi:hypothetical protein
MLLDELSVSENVLDDGTTFGKRSIEEDFERDIQRLIGLNFGNNEKPLTMADVRTVIRTRRLQSISY